jgi:predicted AAA+ superfamily ATPase
MINRTFWIQRINDAWRLRPVVWLSGVNRVGKTTMCKMLGDHTYLNCDLPSVVRRLEDPESFYQTVKHGSLIVFDEIHRLHDPSLVLKIGADEFPSMRILATGSSTLEATRKFRDSLTGRKTTIYLSPVLWDECKSQFNIPELDHRLRNGGLPERLLSKKDYPTFYSEWTDSFFARDVQEYFNVRNRSAYINLMNLLIRSSGNLIDQTQLSKYTGLTRPTISSYLESLRIAHCIFLLTPYHGGGKRELTQRLKCYAFDTGFVCHVKGWNEIRDDDRGILWEHLVMDMIRSVTDEQKIHYWRDKSGREMDFIICQDEKHVHAIECKVNPAHYNPAVLSRFREIYPEGRNFCMSPYIREPYVQIYDGHKVEFCSDTTSLISGLENILLD